MLDLEEKIAAIQDEIRKTPYHKGTEHYIGLLKAKLARLREQLLTKAGKKGSGGVGFAIPKTGDATCVLVGLPSVGKSTILAKLTNAKPKIAPYPFTTLSVIPGVLNYKGASIQILDVPGLVGGAAVGAGRGREVLSVTRVANLLIIVAEAQNFESEKRQILQELEANGIRVEKQQPPISIKKMVAGGLKIITVPNCGLDRIEIVEIAKELGLVNAEIQVKDKITQEELIDSIIGNRVYLPAIFVASKIDLTPFSMNDGVVPIAALKSQGIDKLKEKVWQRLGLIRVYLKPIVGQPDFLNPLILKYGSNIFEAAEKNSQDLSKRLKSAQIVRNNLKKQVSRTFKPQEGDIITFLTR